MRAVSAGVDIGRTGAHVVIHDDPIFLDLDSSLLEQIQPAIALEGSHRHPGRLPDLVDKITADFDFFLVEQHVFSRRGQHGQRKPKCVRSVPVDDIQRVGGISERLAHFPGEQQAKTQ